MTYYANPLATPELPSVLILVADLVLFGAATAVLFQLGFLPPENGERKIAARLNPSHTASGVG